MYCLVLLLFSYNMSESWVPTKAKLSTNHRIVPNWSIALVGPMNAASIVATFMIVRAF